MKDLLPKRGDFVTIHYSSGRVLNTQFWHDVDCEVIKRLGSYVVVKPIDLNQDGASSMVSNFHGWPTQNDSEYFKVLLLDCKRWWSAWPKQKRIKLPSISEYAVKGNIRL
jgi:hypothetical protein